MTDFIAQNPNIFEDGLIDIKIPNELTAETIKKSEAGIELHTVNSVDELFEELES